MALNFITGMTQSSSADSVTNWAAYRLAGSGGAPSAAADAVTYREGAGSISARISGASWDAGLIYDHYTGHSNAVLNLATSGNEVLAVWFLCTSPSAIALLAANGAYILVQSSTETGTTAPTKYAKWTVSGSNVYPGGWVLLMIDTRKTATTTAGGWAAGTDLALTRRIGVGLNIIASPPTLRSDNLYVDSIWYGRPIYRVKGDGSTVATWADFLADSVAANNGLIEDVGGAYRLLCGLRIGDGSQTATTTFSDATGKVLMFQRKTYYQGGVVDALNYADYYLVEGQGAASYRTSITLGSVVGSGDSRQGVGGGLIKSGDITNVTFKVDFQTDKTDLSAVKLYGLQVMGAKGGVLLNNDSGAAETVVCSCQFTNCGEIDPGTTGSGAEILNSFVIDPLGGTTSNRGLLLPTTHHIKRVSFITSGTPTTQHMIRIDGSGTFSTVVDALIMYGDFASGTLYHGELSNAAQATVTLTESNSANPTAAEMHKTGHASSSATVYSPVVLTLIGLISGSDIVILTAGTETERVNVDANSGTSYAFNYTYASSDYVDICVYKAGYVPFAIRNYLLSSASVSLPVAQDVDRNYTP